MIKQLARKIIPSTSLYRLHLLAKYGPADCVDFLRGRREELVPPKRKMFIGGPRFKEIGDEFFGHSTRIGGLTPSSRTLDIGCGIGRMARPLTRFLDRGKGSYEGFDIDKDGVAWCNKHIAPNYPQFHFQRADIYNKYYNPGGRYAAGEYRFPYADASFDFALAASVFTHMHFPDIAHYLAEASRVLKTGGTCLFTFYLMNGEALSLIYAKKSTIEFLPHEDFWVIDEDLPENDIAFSEQRVLSLFEQNGLKIAGKLHYGSWCGRSDYLSYQDIIVARKQ